MSSQSSGAKHESRVAYGFITPFILSFIVFFLVPAIYSIVLSLYQYRGYGTARFIGLGNYSALFRYPFFWTAFGNTIFYFIAHTIPTILLAFAFAIMLRSKLVVWAKGLKAFIFIPQVMAVVCSALVWRVVFSTRSGLINTLLGTEILFLQDKLLMKISVVIMLIWRSIGWFLVIFTASLTSISQDIIESAVIDGANAMQRTTHIIVPLMKPVFAMSLILETIASLKMAVEPNLLISNWLDAPVDAMPILNIVTNNIKGGNFGLASAAGWIIFLLILILSLMQRKIFGE